MRIALAPLASLSPAGQDHDWTIPLADDESRLSDKIQQERANGTSSYQDADVLQR
jgi:hypothetical protein